MKKLFQIFSSTALKNNIVANSAKNSVLIFVVVCFFSFWHQRTTGYLTLTDIGSLALIATLCFVYGKPFAVATPQITTNHGGFVFQFLCGYFVFNTLLFVLELASPLGILTNFSILLLVSIPYAFYYFRHPQSINNSQEFIPSLICIIIAGSAATLWCNDSQPPMMIDGQSVIFKAWKDTFIHAREISGFAQSHGIDTAYDIGFSGIHKFIYHYGSYISTAAVYALTGATAIEVYSSFQLPFGIFLTGLAAFSLTNSIWGKWSGLAATVAILCLPDAYQQGFGNRYLSYNFLAQVNLGMLYGIACVSIAWVFIFDGCARGQYISILTSYIFAAMSLFYKAHIFVANSFLILIFPCIFFVGLKFRWRLVIGTTFIIIFGIAVNYSQSIDRVPVMRLDGSGLYQYLGGLMMNYDEGLIKGFFYKIFFVRDYPKPVNAFYGGAMILLSSFGLWNFAVIGGAASLKGRVTRVVLWFPFFIVANYLVMSMGLAIDSHDIVHFDELLNRPMVWAYFAIVAWTAGGGYYIFFGRISPHSKVAQTGLLVIAILSLTGPLLLSTNLQTFPARPGYSRFEDFNSIPLCLVKTSEYIRDHSLPAAIIQDSENDPGFILTALSERQIFAGKFMFRGKSPAHQEQLDKLLGLKDITDADEVRSFALNNRISFYILRPESQVSWPATILESPSFVCDGYRVYQFSN